jgi:putative transposase
MDEKNFVGLHCWARGYFVSTAGRDEEVIRNYIRHLEKEDEKLDQIGLWR